MKTYTKEELLQEAKETLSPEAYELVVDILNTEPRQLTEKELEIAKQIAAEWYQKFNTSTE